MAQTQEQDILRILIATDNHLGVWENDDVRKDDSFNSFEEIFELAAQQNVDFVLLGGDLFHDNKPSRHTIVRAMDILTRHCLNDRPITFQVLSDQKQNFTTGRVNFENPNFNVGLPVFTIHGNHDDPGGGDGLSAVDILATGSLVNYFGKAGIAAGEEGGPGKVRLAPVLLQKGATRLALYGLGNIRDERLCRLFSTPNAVEWVRPAAAGGAAPGDWFNVFALHQNRVAHTQGAKNCVREGHLARFLDLVVWGHEHECLPDPWESLEAESQFSVVQPGSSVATALSEGESRRKHALLLEVMGASWRTVKFPLETVRPFAFDSLALAGLPGADPERPETVAEALAAKVEAMVAAAARGRGPRAPELPLVRLRVDYTGFSTINPQRFGQRFVGKVANPQDIILWQKAPARRARAARGDGGAAAAAAAAVMAAGEAAAGQEGPAVEDLIEDLIAAHLQQNLEILPEAELTDALRDYVIKGDTKALEDTVKAALEETRAAAVEEGEAGAGAGAPATAPGDRAGRKAEEKALDSQIAEAARKRRNATEEEVQKRRQEAAAKRAAEAAARAAAGPSTAAAGATQRTATLRDAFDADSDEGMAPPPPRAPRGRGRGRSAAAAAAPAPRKRRAPAAPAATPSSRARGSRPAAAAAKQRMSSLRADAYGDGDRSGDEDVDAAALMEEDGEEEDVIEDSDDVEMEEEEREIAASGAAAARGRAGAGGAAGRKRGRGTAKGVGTEEEPISLIDSDNEEEAPSRGGRHTQQGRAAGASGRSQLTFGRAGGPSQLTSKWGGLK